MPFARTEDGAQLSYRTYGAGDREPLLLIAGQAQSHQAWAGIVPRLAEDHPVIAFDHRGVGDSSANVPDEWSTRDFARDVRSVLDHLRVERAHVYGHSMGGRMAQWLAADAPDRIATLTLGGTAVHDASGVPRDPAVTRTLLRGTGQAIRELFFTPAWIEAHPDLARTIRPQGSGPAALRAHFQASRSHDARSVIGAITAPTLILHGADDLLCPVGNAEILAELIPAADLRIFPDMRHGYYLEAADATEAFLTHVQRS